MKNPYRDIFLLVVKNALDKQSQDGSMAAGHNGPYYDPETPVRNTSHWVITFAKAYKLTNDSVFQIACRRALDYLYYNKEFRNGFTFKHREKKGKDEVNGVIGPAWNIEALIEGYQIFNDVKYLNLAKELFNMIPFDYNSGLWKRRLYDGSIGHIDFTFNHQLWFCASGCMLFSITKNMDLKKKILRFSQMLNSNLRIHPSGLIKHGIRNKLTYGQKTKNLIRPLHELYIKVWKGKSYLYKEEGYHLFNLYAFGLIKEYGFELPFYKSRRFERMLNLAFDERFQKAIELNKDSSDISKIIKDDSIKVNRYCYSYNAAGFEMPFIQKIFMADKEKNALAIFNKQLHFTYNFAEFTFDQNSDDPVTLTSRIYELSRIFK
ncbi:MAG: hypothetical protein WD577_08845 [Bacteroidales bacterium]